MDPQYLGVLVSLLGVAIAIIVAICTALYTTINYRMLKESEQSRKQKLDPNIIPYLTISETRSVLEFRLKNVGEGVGFDVMVTVLKDFGRLNDDSLTFSELGAIKNGVSVFPPQYEFKYYIGRLPQLSREHSEKLIGMTISCKSIDNRRLEKSYNLPFNQIFGQNYSSPPDSYIGQIPYFLDSIKSELKVLRKTLSGDKRSSRADETYLGKH